MATAPGPRQVGKGLREEIVYAVAGQDARLRGAGGGDEPLVPPAARSTLVCFDGGTSRVAETMRWAAGMLGALHALPG